MNSNPHITKVVFIGPMKTGKTNIISRLTDREFTEEWVSPIGIDSICKIFDIYGEKVICPILGTVKSM